MKTKNILFLSLMILWSGVSEGQNFKFLSSYNSDGVPATLSGRDYISPKFLNNIKASLPESFPVPTFNPKYIADGIDSDLKLYDQADVWVTFVAEGAGYKNVLGFYTYDLNNPPSKAPNTSEVTIIFPNVSAAGSGGGLVAGDQVYIGSFPKNTGIGWVLYANGFNGKVTTGLWTLFSDPDFNPESKSNQRRHNVLLKDTESDKIVLTFEDIRRDYSNCDQDFNDAIFYVTANPQAAIYKEKINELTISTSSVSSGSDGGLESEGSLADKIAKRNFNRQITPQLDYTRPTEALQYKQSSRAARTSASDLSLFTSEKPFFGFPGFENVVANTSTPNDLKQITNATEVLAVDYFQDTSRIASFLSTYTPNGVYSHTKAICDRLNEATLMKIENITLNDATFILAQLKQKNGDIEYAISFSGYLEAGKLHIESFWTLDEYSKKAAFYNFQAWAINPNIAKQLVIKALQQAGALYDVVLENTDKAAPLPKVYVQNGRYENGQLQLKLSNPSALTGSVTVQGVLARSETNKNKEAWSKTIVLSKAKEENLTIQVGQLFDTGISIVNSVDSQVDNLYLADSPWGYGIASDAGVVSEYSISNNDGSVASTRTTNYLLERNVSMKGTIKSYLSLFKMVEPSAKPVDMSAFGTLKFKAQGTGNVDLVILKKSITNYEEQFRVSIPLSSTERQYMYKLSDFKSTKGGTLKASDVTTVVFGIAGDNATQKPFEISVKDLTFSTDLIMATEEEPVNALAQLVAYPNPCVEDKVKLNFELPEGSEYTVSLYNFMGKKVYQAEKRGVQGTNEISLNVASYMRGAYVCEVKHAQGVIKTKVVLD
jgi:hypothetical protein